MFKSLIWFFLLFCCFNVYGQNQSLKFEHIGTNSGLSQTNVSCIMQDSRGFMWIGTRDGLNKYDGYSFISYKHDTQDANSLTSSMITDVAEDREGNIWIATSIGLNKLERKTGRVVQFRHDDRHPGSITNNVLNKLTIDEAGNLWIAGQGGLDYMDTRHNTFTHYKHDDDIPGSLGDNNVNCVYQDAALNIWAGTVNGGLQLFNKKTKTFKAFTADPENKASISSNNVSCIFEDKKHRLWIGTQNTGLNYFDVQNNTFIHYRHDENSANSITGNNIYCLNNDEDGNLWIGSDNGGLCILNPETRRIYRYQHDDIDKTSIYGNTLYAICKDRHGNMWLGAYSAGISLFKRSTGSFAHYRHSTLPNSLSNDFVLSLFEDHEKHLWVGTDGGGLNKFDLKTGKAVYYKQGNTSGNSIAGNYVLALTEDHQGDIWIGTWADGLSIFDPHKNSFTNIKNIPGNPNSLSGNNIYALIHAKDHTAWIGTYNWGLSHYNRQTNTFVNYRYDAGNPHSLSSDRVFSLLEDSYGNLWVGTSDGGLNLFDKKTNGFIRFKHNDNANSISDDNIPDIFEDSKGRLWVSTYNGLNLFDPVKKRFTVFGKKDGLPSDIICAVKEDDSGKLWVSTNNGLSCFNADKRTFKNYTVEDGLQDNEFKSHSAFKGRSGIMYFGGVQGFNSFSPGRILKPEGFSPLMLTSFQLFNKKINPARSAHDPSPLKQDLTDAKEIELNHKQSVFTLEFAALDYTSADKKKYAYQLEGFDKDWNYVGSRHSATYTNLPAGSYKFKVKYQNTAGLWSPVAAGLTIVTKPPFWLTWWFDVLALLLLIALIFMVFKLRIRAIKAQKRVLQQQVEDRTRRLEKMSREERVLREDADKARESAEKANTAKSIFLATMSHEIRTPMNGVMGMASLLSTTPLNAEQQEYTETIKSCGDTLLNVINDILDFSKIESGNMELEEHNFDLRDCIESVLDVFSERAAHGNIDLVYQIEHNVPAEIVADIVRLKQVLINLVGNAVKFTSRGEVFICVELKRREDNRLELLFEIRDTGIGIPPDKIYRLFKAFSQVDSSTTRKYGGTGLGLAISEKLVKLMGGSIEVDSQVGKGTTFSFAINAKPGKETLRNYEHIDSPEIKNKRVLVVDDNLTNRSILQEQLDHWNLVPVLAAGAQEAFEVIRSEDNIDLVITDMHMPGMDGVELAGKIKEINAGVPIILLSSIGNEHSKRNAHLFNRILTKPAKHHALYKSIIDQLKSNKDMNRTAEPVKAQFSENFAATFPASILIAEDNPINQKLAKYILNKMGYEPDIVSNGRECMNALAAKKYDMVLMDVQMPEMDGLEATRFIRQNMEHQPVIVAMTANALAEDKNICLNAGMDAYLSKPLKLNEIMDILQKWAAPQAIK